jgi:FlaA1/EpsC-like NDP-sugar epimerase
MDKKDLQKILGRKELQFLTNCHKNISLNEKILITGANGSIGTRLIERFKEMNVDFLSTDIEGDHVFLDVTDFNNVKSVIESYNPDIVINIAGAKHAPEGEHETWKTFSINTIGTWNILNCCSENTTTILASTCKSCNPETVYGASKLIAERMVLNSGGKIARFFNVIETQGNVFEIWSKLKPEEPIKVASVCKRHFISLDEATGLVICLASLQQKSIKCIVNSPILREMTDIAEKLYPEKEKEIINPRRGDRIEEKFLSSNESIEEYLFEESIIKIKNTHDKIF